MTNWKNSRFDIVAALSVNSPSALIEALKRCTRYPNSLYLIQLGHLSEGKAKSSAKRCIARRSIAVI